MAHPVQRSRRRSVSGFSLVEALIVVVIMGILVLIITPRFDPVLAGRHVKAAKASFTGLYNRARMAAVQNRVNATITVTGNIASASITTSWGGTQNVGIAVRFDTDFGVTATATPTTVTIQPSGLVRTGLPFELVLVRSSAADTVRITGYGRIE